MNPKQIKYKAIHAKTYHQDKSLKTKDKEKAFENRTSYL